MKKFTYFAYGSNMLTERLLVRCPSAQAIGIAFAEGYAVEFIKESKDNSGKATLNNVDGPGRQAYGVVFEINFDDLPVLDKAEGKGFGYDRVDNFPVTLITDGKPVQGKTYIASAEVIDTGLAPYDWYLALVIQGALQHELPAPYIAGFRDVAHIIDSKPNRKSRKEAIDVLALAEVHDFTEIL